MVEIKNRPLCCCFFIATTFALILSASVSLGDDQNIPPRLIVLPVGDLVDPPIADPKQPQSYASAHHFYIDQGDDFIVGVVGYGTDFGLIRRVGKSWKEGWQLSISGGLFAQFDLERQSVDLLNADYTVGVVATHRWHENSIRIRLYHQSSHLGDELLLRDRELRDNRIDFGYEAIEIVAFRQWGGFRGYGGCIYLIHRYPSHLNRTGIQSGIEYYSGQDCRLRGRPVAGLAVKSLGYNEWDPCVSLRLGLQFGESGPGKPHIRFMLEGYHGFVPFGQFYDLRLTSYGIGVYFGF